MRPQPPALQALPEQRRIDAQVVLPARSPQQTWLSMRPPHGTRLQRAEVDGKPARLHGPQGDRVALPGTGGAVSVQGWYG
ncbi:hypothetical protein ABFU66_08485 [Xanthomonas campestris pv. raphani]